MGFQRPAGRACNGCGVVRAVSRVRRLAVNAADHLMEKKRWEAAASILENYLNSQPASSHDPDVLRRLGKVRLAQGEPKAAAKLFEQALHGYREAQSDSATAEPAVRSSG